MAFFNKIQTNNLRKFNKIQTINLRKLNKTYKTIKTLLSIKPLSLFNRFYSNLNVIMSKNKT